MKPILVFGHKNPDNDSISAAYAYAALKNITDPGNRYLPVRLGPTPPDAAYTFERFGLNLPLEIAGLDSASLAAVDELKEYAQDESPWRVILVDHNEHAQSASGLGEVEIVEIIDHHRAGDIQTPNPILFISIPLGSTASVVTLMYNYLNVAITKKIAGILLSALLTDTVLLKSPTTTDKDRLIAQELSEILGIDYMEYGSEIFEAKCAGEEFVAANLINRDLKEFKGADALIAIGQFEAVSLKEFEINRQEVFAEMKRIANKNGYDALALMATDIVREGTELAVVGNTQLAEQAFGVSFESGSAWLEGVLSRKKQVAPRFMEII